MNATAQPGWTRILTRTGRYEYQFQGRTPAVRNAEYLDATDYMFLLLGEEGWLFRIPVRLAAEAEGEASGPAHDLATRIAEAQLRAGLENYRPRQGASYGELDAYFAVDAARAAKLRKAIEG